MPRSPLHDERAGTFTYEFSHYEEVPSYIAEKIIAESKKEEA